MDARIVRRFSAAMLIATFLPLVASADALPDLQARIQALLSQIHAMQGLMNAASGAPSVSVPAGVPMGGAGTPACPELSGPLSLGSRGDAVSALQQFLIDQGFLENSAPTGFFGPLTEAAVEKFQNAQNVIAGGAAGWGKVGPRTAAAILNVCSRIATRSNPLARSCLPALPPTTICSTGWQANTDANGCTTSYKCSIPLPGWQPPTINSTNVSNASCTAVSLICPDGEYDYADQNCSHRCVANATVSSSSTASFSASPTSGQAPLAVYFYGSVNGNSTYTIDFGDGSSGVATIVNVGGGYGYTGPGLNAYHVYSAAGTYTSHLISSGTIIGSATITVSGTVSFGTLAATPQSGTAPLAVTFMGNGGGGSHFGGVQIDFGDGTTATFCNPGISCGVQTSIHTYNGVGTFTAKLIGVGEGNGNIIAAQAIAVAAPQVVGRYCAIDCISGYHASGPSGSCNQTCIPDSTSASSCTTPWGSLTVQSGQAVINSPYFNSGQCVYPGANYGSQSPSLIGSRHVCQNGSWTIQGMCNDGGQTCLGSWNACASYGYAS